MTKGMAQALGDGKGKEKDNPHPRKLRACCAGRNDTTQNPVSYSLLSEFSHAPPSREGVEGSR